MAARRAPGFVKGFESLEDREFRWWFASQILSSSGNMTQTVGLSWLVLRTTGSPIALSVVSACSFGPSFVLGPMGGAITHRWAPRSVLLFTQSGLMLGSLALFGLDLGGTRQLVPLLAVALASGIVFAIDGPARQIIIRDLVGGGGVASAVSLYEVANNVARVFGPALGGLLLATSGSDACFLANAATFVLPIGVLLAISPPDRAKQHVELRVLANIRSGIRYVAARSDIRFCIGVALGVGLVFNPGVLLPIMVREVLGRGGGSYGITVTALGIGSVPGALMAGRAGPPTGTILLSLVAATSAAILVTAASPNLPTLMCGEAAIGFCAIWTIAAANTMVQLRTSRAMRGVVMGLWVSAIPGTYPLSALIAGGTAQLAGGRVAFCIPGFALLALLLSGWVRRPDWGVTADEV